MCGRIGAVREDCHEEAVSGSRAGGTCQENLRFLMLYVNINEKTLRSRYDPQIFGIQLRIHT